MCCPWADSVPFASPCFPHLSFRNRQGPPVFLVGCSRGVCPRVGSARGSLHRRQPAALSSPHCRLPHLPGSGPGGPGAGGSRWRRAVSLCLRMSALRSWQSAVSVCGAGAGVFTVSPSTAAVPAHQIWGLPAFSSPSPGPEQESQDHEEAAAQAQAGEEALRRGVRSEKK